MTLSPSDLSPIRLRSLSKSLDEMDDRPPAKTHTTPRPSLIVKMKGPHERKKACKPCQLRKTRCEYDEHHPSAPCKRCTRKEIDCVLTKPRSGKRKLSSSSESTSPSKRSLIQPVEPPRSQVEGTPGGLISGASDATHQSRHEDVQDDESELPLRSTTLERPPGTTSKGKGQTSQQGPYPPTASHSSSLHSTEDSPSATMLLPISQIREVLDIYDRRKQQIQQLKAQVDHLERSRRDATEVAKKAETQLANSHATLDQQRSLIAALGGALIRHANIKELNQLYNVLEDLGVDQTHYWALHDNDEFRKSFAASCEENGTRLNPSISANAAKEEDSPLQQALDAVNHTPSSSSDGVKLT